MDYDAIFEAYYNLYRLEAATPGTTDDEYVIGMRLANEAINRWANYDGTYWNTLFTTLQTQDDGDKTFVLAQSDYAAPTDFKEAGGYVKVLDVAGNTVRRIPIIEPNEAQFRSDQASYCYFTGDPNNGFTLHINGAIDTSIAGFSMDYIYYKKPTLFTAGTSVTEMPDPYFAVNRMLAQRFRGSRNPYYASAKADAEDGLKTMQAENNSGSWANPWKLADNSGTVWGM
jgi:hypothetical protein